MSLCALFVIFLLLDFCALVLINDTLLRIQYKAHRADWVSEGGNRGFFWVPPGHYERFLLNIPWSQRGWLSSTPQWASDSPRLKRLFHLLHVCQWLWVVGVFVAMVVNLTPLRSYCGLLRI